MSKNLMETQRNALIEHGFDRKETGLVIVGQPTLDEWTNFGKILNRIEGSIHWWIGDWLNYGERMYGEKYTQALDEMDYAYQTLRDDAWVAGKIELSRRRDNLSWSHHKEVASLEASDQDRLLDEAELQGWSRNELRKAIALPPHVSHNSGNNEWYTPEEYIEAARTVMGVIDLDPASSAQANSVIKAESIYTIEDDGLSQDWCGNIWLNPPYASELIPKFVDKLTEQVSAKNVESAIVLVNNATETKWFRTLVDMATGICFPIGRVKFWQADGKIGAPLQGQAFIYIGPNFAAFRIAFDEFGWIATL
jgi:phage N-6-adenine-methyltransferase